VYSALLMEGKQNMWSPWYLMREDKLGNVECKFYDNIILYYKDRMLFHLGYQYDGNGRVGVAVCWHTWWKHYLLDVVDLSCTTKWHGSTNPYPGWVNKRCGHGNAKSFSGKRIFFDISSGRGLKFHPPINNIKGSNKSTNSNIWTFR
jgi:hypothetical protein